MVIKKQKNKKEKILVAIGVIFLAIIIINGYIHSVKNSDFEKNNELALEAPMGFDRVVVDGVSVNIPSSWGESEIVETPEYLSDRTMPGISFKGAVAVFYGRPSFSLRINEIASIRNVERSRNIERSINRLGPSNSLSRAIGYMEKIYLERSVKPEEFYTYPELRGVHGDLFHSVFFSHNPRYVESNNGNWRGFWTVAQTGNGLTAHASIVAILYNKDSEKFFTIIDFLETEKSKSIEDRHDRYSKEYSENNRETDRASVNVKIPEDIREYLKSAYHTDQEVVDYIDNYLIVILETLS